SLGPDGPAVAQLRQRRPGIAGRRAGAKARIEVFAAPSEDVLEAAYLAFIATQPDIVVTAHGEFDWRHERRRRHIAEGAFRHAGDVDHKRDAAARPDIDRRAADRDIGFQALHRAGQVDRAFSDAGAQRAAGAADEQHRAKRRLTIV